MKLIIGLGNPDKKYENTYHNIGYLAIDFLTGKNKKFKVSKSKKFKYFKTENLIFAKSLTFMNNSGEGVKEAMEYFKIKPKNILIIHDDSDIKLGNYKLSFNKNSAGHLGIQSVIDKLGTKKFFRLRIGIRKIGDKRKAAEIVLSKITKENKEIITSQIFYNLKQILFYSQKNTSLITEGLHF